jgi:hypothetical protein
MSSSLADLKKSMAVFDNYIKFMGRNEPGSKEFAALTAAASIEQLVELMAEIQARVSSSFYSSGSANDPVSKMNRLLDSVPSPGLRIALNKVKAVLCEYDRQELIRIAETAHPAIMIFLINTTDVGSKDFVRKDDEGREQQLGVDLGL